MLEEGTELGFALLLTAQVILRRMIVEYNSLQFDV